MSTVTRVELAAAAPRWVRDLLAAGSGEATVVHAGPDALYLALDSDVLAITTRAAVQVPCALRTTLSTTADLSASGEVPPVGTAIPIVARRVHLSGATVRIGRTIDTTAPRIDPATAPAMAERLSAALGPGHARARAELPEAGLGLLEAAEPDAVVALLGRGSGLTPVGDDVLCGWLATMVAASYPGVAPVAERVIDLADHRTTALSATLLRRSVHAEVVPQFGQLLTALAHPSTNPAESLASVTRIGHTSGDGLVLGLALALAHLAPRSSCT
ncbi:DUF2877 domain-containing protein [Janibacter alittae]|uniref:DUF2877 domain-containing protein n=1 Tax=Janibacter alittae TaxID=3115209 RepID=A0ABZ2MGL0_9MICO